MKGHHIASGFLWSGMVEHVLRVIRLTVAVLLVAAPASAWAGLVNDVPSCYAATHIAPPAKPYAHLIYILMDQTVKLPPALEQSAVNNALRMLKPGTKFVIAEFSAFSQGHFLQVVHTGIVEKPLAPSRIGSTSMVAARHLNVCLGMQYGFARKMVATSMASIMESSTSSLDQSDIMMAMKTVAPAIARDPAAQKVLFAITDGLENSSVTTFYGNGTVRVINPAVEMGKAIRNHLIGNFGGASVYVLGGAVMPPAATGTLAARNGYRDPQALINLKDFWRQYFAKSDGKLMEFGEPALVEPVAYPETH
ncbi:hypothetical protein [Acidithiobacillus ferrooxidans]|uniref:hypothetical protein n=1 Tax=Acidithiobacillus ferrooxidans TaxID=920 RepID=UPI001C066BDE|nr:hypothetical protein [Acidithiobacillus ferrooxidans]